VFYPLPESFVLRTSVLEAIACGNSCQYELSKHDRTPFVLQCLAALDGGEAVKQPVTAGGDQVLLSMANS
jgi:hypothetical protein